ncbi:MAG: DNA polymerase III subunit delta' [Pseudomonadota bacterium]
MTDAAVPCPWHLPAWQALQARVAARLPHALLLSGEPGTGKRLFADAFAAWLLCPAPVGGMACGRCKSCLLVAAGTHPDRLLVTPQALRADGEGDADGEAGGSRKKKPSAEIRVDDVRALIVFAAQTAQFGGRRVVVIDPAAAMNVNAANALLKTLEEPGPGVVLLLVCEQPALLPATIRSRCQPLPLPAPSPVEARDWLAARAGDIRRAQDLLAAAGAPTRALTLLDDEEWVGQRRKLATLLVDVLAGEQPAARFAELAAKATRVADAGTAATEPLLLDWLPSLLSDAVRLAGGVPLERLRNADLVPELRRLVAARTTQPLFLLGDDVARLRQQLDAGSGLNRQLLWEEVMLRWSPRPRGGTRQA